jgi:sugar phosphate isomerase/epimerase
MMKIGVMICSYYLHPDGTLPKIARQPPLDEIPALTAKLGITALELQDPGGGFEELFPELPTTRRLKRLIEIGESAGVEIPVISAMGGNLLSANEDAQISYVRKWLKLAASVGITTLKINVGMKPTAASKAKAFERALSALRRCSRIAEDYGVVLAPELWPPSYPTSDVHAMITLMMLIDSKNLRHTIDNYQLPPDWAVPAFERLIPFTSHVHMSTRGLPDTLNNDPRFEFSSFIRILKTASYDGYVMIEARPRSDLLSEKLREVRDAAVMLQSLISSNQ